MPKERQTCTECSMRRQKCDRNLPCGRCVKRGEPEKCTREWPKEGYDPRKHRIYPRPDKDDQSSPGTDSDKLRDRPSPSSATALHDEYRVHPSLRASESSPTNRPTAGTPTVPTHKDLNAENEKEATVLDFVTWGRSDLADYQVKSFDLLKEPFKNNSRLPCPEQEYSNGFGNTNTQQISFLQLLLPRRVQVFELVDYHLNNILWYHACVHGETFRNELQSYYLNADGLQIRDTDLRWMALLFAILSCSMTCAHDSLTSTWGFQRSERYKLTRQWYKASLSCLNLADYMWRHHLSSIQAICVLTMSGHILGFSNTQSTLHGAALKIAQGLGLQRLGPEADESITNDRDLTPAKKEKIIRREIGRRCWSQICNQDWFSIPFSEMYSIQSTHYSTSRPQHIDDRTLLPIPAHEPSVTSFARVLHDIARIMPQAHDALLNASTLYTKYEQVLHYDAKIKGLATEGIPSFFSSRESNSLATPEWLPWARRSIRLCVAHKTIMIHRSFLGKSLTDATFAHTRRTCMDAARTILRDARQANDQSGEPMLWIDQAFMVAAGITLSLDIFHRQSIEPEYADHRKHVESAINMLSKYEHSMIALRGVRLLTSLLAEEARLTAEKSMENYNKKRSREDNLEATTQNGSQAPGFAQIGEGSFSHALKKQKFDVPKFLESFVGSDSNLSQSLRSSARGEPGTPFGNENDTASATINGNGDMVLGHGRLGNLLMQQQGGPDKLAPISAATVHISTPSQMPRENSGDLPVDYGYEAFEQIFPPHAGISNSFLYGREPPNVEGNPSPNAALQVDPATLTESAPSKQQNVSEGEGPSSQIDKHESRADKVAREKFLPYWLTHKQPELPGVFGAWNPTAGRPKEAPTEWPRYDASMARPGEIIEPEPSSNPAATDDLAITEIETSERRKITLGLSSQHPSAAVSSDKLPRSSSVSSTHRDAPEEPEKGAAVSSSDDANKIARRMWDVATPGSGTLTFNGTEDYISAISRAPTDQTEPVQRPSDSGPHDRNHDTKEEANKSIQDQGSGAESKEKETDTAVSANDDGKAPAKTKFNWFGQGSIWSY